MKNKDIDAFLGDWMPTQEGDIRPFLTDGSVEVLGPNLTGAKYTLAVPAYAYAMGLRDFNDIKNFAPQLKTSIFGIEPGNDGNRLILGMLKQNLYGLGDFKLIESSEQGMLAEVERMGHAKSPIVFLAWDPHPMNMRFDLRYLSGGDAVFGPNFGGATVYTVIRTGYSAECPNPIPVSSRAGSPASTPPTAAPRWTPCVWARAAAAGASNTGSATTRSPWERPLRR
jgi:glycine betaine/proline transport system substrate-binding protein